MRFALSIGCAVVAFGCSWPDTKMEPAPDYGSAARPTISSATSYRAGTNYERTYSPDGSTLFVCSDGGTVHGSAVAPMSLPAC